MKTERKGIITISENGNVSVPVNVQMRDFEIAELLGVMIPAVKSNIQAIIKIKSCDGGYDQWRNVGWKQIFCRTTLAWIWSWLLLFGFIHGRQRFSGSGY
jgi:hypothetical protein